MTDSFYIKDFCVRPEINSINIEGKNISLEPKVMQLLCLLASEPKKVFTKQEISMALWPDAVVGDDTLARSISKLRRVLSDNAKSPSYVETISKRGYRLIADVSSEKSITIAAANQPSYNLILVLAMTSLLLVAVLVYFVTGRQDNSSQAQRLTDRADILYMKFTRVANEAAATLYERAIIQDQNYPLAQAGLANTLIQKVIRWQKHDQQENNSNMGLTYAVQNGLTKTEFAVNHINRANTLAEKAFRLSPNDPHVLKALAFSYSAQGKFDKAIEVYKKSIQMDDNAWKSIINLAELYQIKGQHRLATESFIRAYQATERVYLKQPLAVSLWQTRLGTLVGQGYETLGDFEEAKIWYRRVLEQAPYDVASSIKLATLLANSGQVDEAKHLCQLLNDKVGSFDECDNLR